MCQALSEGSLYAPPVADRRHRPAARPQAGAPIRSIVHAVEVQDQKAVVATVEPVHQLVARARIGGTIVALKAKEGDTRRGRR